MSFWTNQNFQLLYSLLKIVLIIIITITIIIIIITIILPDYGKMNMTVITRAAFFRGKKKKFFSYKFIVVNSKISGCFPSYGKYPRSFLEEKVLVAGQNFN